MAFETVRRFLDGVYYNQDDMANSFNGVFGNLNNITANVSGLNVVLSGGYVLLNGYFINFVGVDTVAVTANASGFIYVSYDFSDDTYSISYAATIPADSDTIKNLGIYSTVSTASAVTLTKINNNDSMFAIINSAIAKINADISAVNTNLGYKFDLGSTGGAKNKQNANGSILLTNTDLNNVLYTGAYYCGAGVTNRPNLNANGTLEVVGYTDTLLYQRYREMSSGNLYERNNLNGAWSDWVRSTVESKFVEVRGTVSLTNGSGSVTGIAYPTGFTQSNCYAIVSVYYSNSALPEFGVGNGKWRLVLNPTNMNLVVSTYDGSTTGPSGDRTYKIMLIKNG